MARAKLIRVKSATKDRKVALSEGHKDHPGGEAFVVGYPDLPDGTEDPMNIVEVAETPLVRRKLANDELIQVDQPSVRSAPVEPVETQDTASARKK